MSGVSGPVAKVGGLQFFQLAVRIYIYIYIIHIHINSMYTYIYIYIKYIEPKMVFFGVKMMSRWARGDLG